MTRLQTSTKHGLESLTSWTRRTRRRFAPQHYAPLKTDKKEIRLLVLKPGVGEEPLQCAFQQAFLVDRTPQYETISYVWGDAMIRGTVILNGNPLDIPESAENVLRRVRYADKDRLLWIDAVCINQGDVVERASQVILMSDIFTKTHRTLVWLGPDSESTPTAIESIKLMANELRRMWSNIGHNDLFSSEVSLQPAVREQLDIPAVQEFFRSAWFTRAWVVQEVALAPRTTCLRGQFEATLVDVLDAAVVMTYKVSNLPVDFELQYVGRAMEFSVFAESSVWSKKEYTLSDLLIMLTRLAVSDPRDFVYGALGLYQRSLGLTKLPTLLQPDYTAPFARVWQKAMRQAILDAGSLAILSRKRSYCAIDGLPSWTQIMHDNSNHIESRIPPGFKAASTYTMDPTLIRKHKSSLAVSGFVVDTVKDLVTTLCKHTAFNRKLGELIACLEQIEDFIRTAQPNAAVDVATQTAMVLQCGIAGYDSVATRAVSGTMYTLFKSLPAEEMVPHWRNGPLIHPTGENTQLMDFLKSIRRFSLHRPIFSTERGFVGKGVPHMLPGDTVAILYGCAWPVLLRPCGDSQYTFLGACYVDGIMFGEHTIMHKSSGARDIEFHLV